MSEHNYNPDNVELYIKGVRLQGFEADYGYEEEIKDDEATR